MRHVLRIAATFIAEPLRDVLSFWGRKLNHEFAVEFAPSNNVVEELLQPTRREGTERNIFVALIRLDDWLGSGDEAAARLEFVASNFLNAVTNEAIGGQPIIVVLCHGIERIDAANATLSSWRQKLDGLISEVAGISLMWMEDVVKTYAVQQIHDVYMDREAKVPYTSEYFAALGSAIVRKVIALESPPIKVIVTDCDGVLWGGICGEDGAEAVTIDSNYIYLQKFLSDQQARGRLLCICSKNEEEDVKAVFAQRKDQLAIGLEDFILTEISWRPKSESMYSLAHSLGLGLESFLLLDDSPVECEEVRRHCPQALTLGVPPGPELPAFLDHIWPLDRGKATREDRDRADHYRKHIAREKLRQASVNLAEFITGLEVSANIRPLDLIDVPRASQLTYRTNQFNTSGIRLSEVQMARLLREKAIYSVHLTDKFGDYGLVGLMLCTLGENALEVNLFLLSCRALGRTVEHKMLAFLGETALACNLQHVTVRFTRTDRNTISHAFFSSIPSARQENQEQSTFTYAASLLVKLPMAVSGAMGLEQQKEEPAFTQKIELSARLPQDQVAEIAHSFRTAHQVLEAVRMTSPAAALNLGGEVAIEETVASIWQQLLGRVRVGLQDDFFQLGGHSLQAMRFVSRIRDIYGIELPLTLLFADSVTVEIVASVIREQVLNEQQQIISTQR